MDREDVLDILNEVYQSSRLGTKQELIAKPTAQRNDSGLGLDSGLGSQSLTAERSQGKDM